MGTVEEPINHTFVTAMIKGDAVGPPGHWAIKCNDTQSGNLKIYWDERRATHYAPMRKQGAIILGVGGGGDNRAIGTFYEGCMTHGYTTDATDDAVQGNVVAAGYVELASGSMPAFI